MLEELKKKSIKKSLFATILLLIAGIGLIVLEFSNLKSLLKGPVQFETLKPEEITEDLIVDASININFGAFMERYEKNTKTNVERTTDLYYVILTGDEYDDDFCFMGLKVSPTYMKRMDKMAEASYYGEATETIKFSGAINKMDKDEYKYFKEYLMEGGLTAKEVEEYALPYYISSGALTGGAATTVYVITGLGVLLILFAVFRVIYALNGGNLNKLKKEIEASGYSEERVSSEYASAPVLNKGNELRIGKTFLFYLDGSKPRLIKNDSIVWAYQKTTTHRTNGIKTGTTYSILIYLADKKTRDISVNSEAVAKEVLQCMEQNIPRAVLGYSEELNRIYRREYDNFLKLRYNNPEYNTIDNTGFNTEYNY